MRIGIDAHVLGSRAGGNETYMRNLLEALRAHAPNTDLITFVNAALHGQADVASGFPTRPIPFRSSYMRVPFGLPWAVRQTRVDVLHVQYTAPPWCPCRFVISMHDIVALRFPESMPFADRHRLRLLSGNTLRRAARVFVLTNALRDEIAEYYHVPQERFDLVQPVSDPLYCPITDTEILKTAQQKYKAPGEYLLYVGLLQPRKNLVRLAQAYARVRERGIRIPLVIVGKRAWLYGEMLEAIEALQLGDALIFTDYVDREDLPALYSGATAFAYISLYEGFGIPLIEALACGTPSLASTDPALVEVAGGAALHTDPLDVEAITDALMKVITDSSLQEKLKREGPLQARRFTSEAMARAAVEGYRKAVQ